MMTIPSEFISQRRGSLEDVGATTSICHTRARSLKERLLQRKLPNAFSFSIANDDVTHRGGHGAGCTSNNTNNSRPRDLKTGSVQSVFRDETAEKKRPLTVTSTTTATTSTPLTPTKKSTTVARWSSFRDARTSPATRVRTPVRRSESRQHFDELRNSAKNLSASTDNNAFNSYERLPPFPVAAVARKSPQAQFSGSTPILFSKQNHQQRWPTAHPHNQPQPETDISSPVPIPRHRRARSETERRPGSFKARKGPPPKPPSPAESRDEVQPRPEELVPDASTSTRTVIVDNDQTTARRLSNESRDEGIVILSRNCHPALHSSTASLLSSPISPSPTPASVVKALAPLLAPVFAVASTFNAVKSAYTDATVNTMTHKSTAMRPVGGSNGSVGRQKRPGAVTTGKSDSDSGFEMDSSAPTLAAQDLNQLSQADFEQEYDIVQKVGEGWFSRVYLTEHRQTREEIVLKAINRKSVSAEDFLREFHNSYLLSAHANVITVYDVVFQVDNYFMFATEYAPLGDLTSNIGDHGIGELPAKRVAKQIGSALEWVHSKNLCHLDVKLDNILVFDSDFLKVKLCDFGAVKSQGDIVIKKNELLPYCPPELVAKHANEYYQVDRVQDVFQFGIVIFFCLFGILPWQRADTADPNFAEFHAWRRKRTSKVPKNFKPMSSRGQKLFRKLLDPDPEKRLKLSEVAKYLDDKWLSRIRSARSLLNLTAASAIGAAVNAAHMAAGGVGVGGGHRAEAAAPPATTDPATKFLSDGISQLTMGSFQSVHSNAVEKNRVLYTLLQHGVETTVDRNQKNSRIINWICHGQASEGIDFFGPEIDPDTMLSPASIPPEEELADPDEEDDLEVAEPEFLESNFD